MALEPFVGPWPLSQFLDFYTVGRSSCTEDQPVAHTEQQKHRINAYNIDVHALSGIRTHDPSARTSEDNS
jgi:hypothetical protein